MQIQAPISLPDRGAWHASHFTEIDTDKQVVHALGSDTVAAYADNTHFVFHHHDGEATIYGFAAAGEGHDVLSLPSSVAGKLAQIWLKPLETVRAPRPWISGMAAPSF